MTQPLHVALDLLREALYRKWFLGLFLAITLVLGVLGLSLRLDVVDGAIAGSRLFGKLLSDDIVQADAVLRPLYTAVAYGSFYLGSLFLCVSCSDFAPNLLQPGRIEHLLALPVTRWNLVLGTYLGVLGLGALCTGYGALGVTVLFGVKTGLWSGRLLWGSLLGMVGFAAVYAVMLAAVFFVRSAALSAASGVSLLVLGVLSTQRNLVIAVMEPGAGRDVFGALMQPIPRLFALATAGADLAAGRGLDGAHTAELVLSVLAFSAALLALTTWRFERMDV